MENRNTSIMDDEKSAWDCWQEQVSINLQLNEELNEYARKERQWNIERAELYEGVRVLNENLARIIDRIEENNLQDKFPSAFARAKEALSAAKL